MPTVVCALYKKRINCANLDINTEQRKQYIVYRWWGMHTDNLDLTCTNKNVHVQ